MKKKYVYIIILIIVICFSILSILKKNDISSTFTDFTLKSYDENLISKSSIEQILNTCSFTNKNTTYFSSSPLYVSTNNYFVYWNLKTMYDLNYSYNELCKVKEYLDFTTNDDLNNLKLLSEINKIYEDELISNNELYEKTFNHYDQETCLFYYNDVNDNISIKLAATLTALEILQNINMLEYFPFKDSLLNNIIELYHNNNYFDINDVDMSLLNCGTTIINCLIILDIDSTDINYFSKELQKNRNDWLKYWNENTTNILKYDLYSLLILNNLYNINVFYKNTIPNNVNYFYTFFKEYEMIDLAKFTSSESESYIIDPQLVNIIYNLCIKYNHDCNFKNDIIKYINDNLETQYKKYCNIIPNIIDNYYGILLAINFKYDFDLSKMETLINNFYTSYIEEGSNIFDNEEFIDTYYLLATYKVLNLKIPDKKTIYNSINIYFTNLPYSNLDEIKTAIIMINAGLDIYNSLDYRVPKQIKNKFTNICDSIVNNKYVFEDISTNCFLKDTLERFNLVSKYKVIYNNSINNIEKLKINGGYSYKIKIEADITSSYKGYKSLNKNLDNREKNLLKDFLFSLKSNNSFYISASGSAADLRSIYEALKLSTLYKEIYVQN